MIKSYTACTSEIDDKTLAVAEILEQLKPKENCLKNSVAIVTCYYEFATNGIIAELYKELNFPIIGTTTIAVSTNCCVGQLELAIIMITSDDVTFTAACSESLKNGLEQPFTNMYREVLQGHKEAPKLILSAAPLMLEYAGDSYIEILDKVSGGVPNFGTLAIDDTQNYDNSYVIFNDKVANDIYGIIAASGNINPKFLYASISPEHILAQIATITKSEGNILKEVNGLPFGEYLATLGLGSNKAVEVLHSIPLILYHPDEVLPISRVILSWDENGFGAAGGLMKEGSKMRIGIWHKEDVLETTSNTIKSILQNENIGALIIYSCMARSYALGTDILSEAETVKEMAGERLPYIFSYSGGEICPIRDMSNMNNFHNNTVIVCAF